MSWVGRIRDALRPGRVSREIDRELAFHLTERIEELQASGLSEAEAVRAAQRRLGTKRTTRKGLGTCPSISESRRRCGTSATRRGRSGMRPGLRRR